MVLYYRTVSANDKFVNRIIYVQHDNKIINNNNKKLIIEKHSRYLHLILFSLKCISVESSLQTRYKSEITKLYQD